jgi:hypothetical protein
MTDTDTDNTDGKGKKGTGGGGVVEFLIGLAIGAADVRSPAQISHSVPQQARRSPWRPCSSASVIGATAGSQL